MNILLVNKNNKLNSNYIPDNLVVDEDGIISSVTNDLPQIVDEVKIAFNELKKEAKINGYNIFLNSGYRSYETQKKLIRDFLKNMTFDEVMEKVAIPG